MVFHWLTAILVATQWLGAQTIDWFPRGPLRVDARSVHITVGVLLGLVLAGRIVWRATEGRRLPLADLGAVGGAVEGNPLGLYLLLIAMICVGLFLAWTRGDSLFNLFSIPAYDPGNKALVNQTQELHAQRSAGSSSA